MLEDADDRLFNKINNNDEHVLHCILPPPQLLHNITNWDKDRTTEPCLHAPAVSLTLILSIDYCSRIFTNILTTFTTLAGIGLLWQWHLSILYIVFIPFYIIICVGCGLYTSTSIKDFNNNNKILYTHKTRMNGLSCGEERMTIWYNTSVRVTDRETDRQTDRQKSYRPI